MDGRRHFRNVVVLWLLATVILTPIVVFVLGPGLPPGNGSVEASGQVTDNTVLLALATPVALGVLVYMGYAMWAFRERDPEVVADGASDPRRLERPVLVAGGHDHARAVPCRLWHRQAAGRRVRRRSGSEPDRHPGSRQGRPAAAGAGHRSAVAVHLPLPRLRRRRDSRARAAGKQADRVPRDLARRDPLILGVRPRRQGRRQPGRGQRRVRDDQGTADVPRAMRRAVRRLAWVHVQPGPGCSEGAVRLVDRPATASSMRRPRRACRRTRRGTSRTRKGEADERDCSVSPGPSLRLAAADRLQPADRDRARDRRLVPRPLHRRPNPREPTWRITRLRRARTTSQSCSATSSVSSAFWSDWASRITPSSDCWGSHRAWPRGSQTNTACCGTSACPPITRSSPSSTWSGSGCSSSSAG